MFIFSLLCSMICLSGRISFEILCCVIDVLLIVLYDWSYEWLRSMLPFWEQSVVLLSPLIGIDK